MNMKQIWKRWIAIVLVITLSLTSVPVSWVQAETNSSGKAAELISELGSIAGHEVEKAAEAKIDSQSSNSAGDWYVATKIDNLAWNYFHNIVQEDIMSKYSYIGSVEREVEIKDKYVEGKPTGRPGRADIGITMMGITYLWEVKPWSYRDDPKKRTSAQDQLAGYVDSNADFKTGGNQIEGGTAARSFTRVREGAIEEVTYEITYIVESDGLIFYKFERSSKKSTKNRSRRKLSRFRSPFPKRKMQLRT